MSDRRNECEGDTQSRPGQCPPHLKMQKGREKQFRLKYTKCEDELEIVRAGKKQREKQEGERFVKSWERWEKVYIEYFKVKIEN